MCDSADCVPAEQEHG